MSSDRENERPSQGTDDADAKNARSPWLGRLASLADEPEVSDESRVVRGEQEAARLSPAATAPPPVEVSPEPRMPVMQGTHDIAAYVLTRPSFSAPPAAEGNAPAAQRKPTQNIAAFATPPVFADREGPAAVGEGLGAPTRDEEQARGDGHSPAPLPSPLPLAPRPSPVASPAVPLLHLTVEDCETFVVPPLRVAEVKERAPTPPTAIQAPPTAIQKPTGAFDRDTVAAILEDFQDWLREAKEVPAAAPAPNFDLATVVQQFTALRQDVNLQTKASRSQLEQNAQALDVLFQAHEALKQQLERLQEFSQQEQDELRRPFLKTLIDAHDALSLACREVQRKLEQMRENTAPPTPVIELPAPPPPPAPPAAAMPRTPAQPASLPSIAVRLPAWARWLGLGVTVEEQMEPIRAWHQVMRIWHEEWQAASPAWHQAMQAWHQAAHAWHEKSRQWYEAHASLQTAPAPEDPTLRFREILDTLLVGYQMSLERLERAMQNHGLQTIPCADLPFDPETMEVVEVVRDQSRAGAEVLEVVRNGYRWQGRLFRFAQVRVAKP